MRVQALGVLRRHRLQQRQGLKPNPRPGVRQRRRRRRPRGRHAAATAAAAAPAAGAAPVPAEPPAAPAPTPTAACAPAPSPARHTSCRRRRFFRSLRRLDEVVQGVHHAGQVRLEHRGHPALADRAREPPCRRRQDLALGRPAAAAAGSEGRQGSRGGGGSGAGWGGGRTSAPVLDEVSGEAGADRLLLSLREARPVLEGEVGERIQRRVPCEFSGTGPRGSDAG